MRQILPNLHQLINQLWICNAYIAGSFAAFYASDYAAPPNDLDVFLSTPSEYENVIGIIRRTGFVQDPTTEYVSEWARTFVIDPDSAADFFPAQKIQVIRPNPTSRRITFGNVGYVLDHFDFTVCQAALSSNGNDVVIGEDTLEDLHKRQIIVVDTHTPYYSIQRAFAKSNHYSLPRSELFKLMRAWEELPEDERHEELYG